MSFFFNPLPSLGPMTILPLRRLYIERQVQPDMLSFASTEDVVALFNMCVLCNLTQRALIVTLLFWQFF
jgi:hypothetical protein